MSVTDTQAAEALARLVNNLLAHAADTTDDLDHLIAALDIVQWMCWEKVRLKDIPEPVDMGAMKKAVAASVIERLVQVYASPPHNQPQRVPEWCAGVPPSPVEVWLVNREWAEGITVNPIFRRRNIMAMENFLMFV